MDLSQFSTPEIAVAMVFTGIVVVFSALLGLWLIVALFGKGFSSLTNSSKPKPAAPTPPAPPKAAPKPVSPMQVEDGIGDEVVAAIAAAVSAMSGGNAVIRSVRRAGEGRSNWAQAGVAQNTQPF